MPLQDLTPQLRTRLTKMERSVGWFVFLATVLLLFGFGDYLYHAAETKGLFNEKAKFYTYANSAANINVSDPVYLMGFRVGTVTAIAALPPRTPHNVRIDFVIDQVNRSNKRPVPYFGYVWNQGSYVKLNTAGFLGEHGLEITRSTNGYSVYLSRKVENISLTDAQKLQDPGNWRLAENLFDTNSKIAVPVFTSFTNLSRILDFATDSVPAIHLEGNSPKHIYSVWDETSQRYWPYNDRNDDPTNSYYLPAADTPAIADQLQAIVSQVQQAVPNVLALTNKLAAVLENAANATSNLNITIAATQPLVRNFTSISGDLHGPGALGTWVLGTNSAFQIETALTNANTLLVSVNTNLDTLTDQAGLTLINLANITSNLNVQVAANSNMLWGISKTVTDSDDFIQGLKRHWLLRSAFKKKASDQPAKK